MQVPEQPIAIVRARANSANLPAKIRESFDQFYADFKGKGGLNIVYYPGSGVAGEFDIACGVQLEQGGNASTPAGTVATTVYMGPYNQMKPAHLAIHVDHIAQVHSVVRIGDQLGGGLRGEDSAGHGCADPVASRKS